MGTGASQSLRGHHSDSRISSLRLDGGGGGAGTVTAVADSSRSSCNNTVTLRFNLQDYTSSGSGASLGDSGKKPRARSLDGPDTSAATATAAAVSHELQALDEGREDHNSSAATMVVAAAAAETESNNKQSPRSIREDHDDELLEYDEDPFEEDDEPIEWTKADALGSGSYGTVYLARDERTGALMAVKEIIVADESDLDVANASREVTLLRSLRHVNIVKYLGSHVDVNARKLHIFTEWVPGGNLEQNRKRFAHHGSGGSGNGHAGTSERVVRRFTRQILSGVAYLHAKRIIHHDIKPSNLLVDQHGVVKLADFGSSRLLSSTSTVVNNESMRGTPNYMAPEVIKQSGPRSVASDIWSVGCSVLRLLTGKPLWGDKKFDSQIALLYFIAHLDTLPPLPAGLSRDAQSFLSLCLEIDPERRPSAEQLLTHPFVGGTGTFPTSTSLSGSSSFLLPSRSTLLTLPPLHQPSHNTSDLRVLTAPADYDAVLVGAAAVGGGGSSSPRAASQRRSPPASAPSSSSSAAAGGSAMASRSQFVGTRQSFPSSGATSKQDVEKDNDADDDAPEIASLSSLLSLPSVRSSSSNKSTKHMSRSRMSSSIVSLLSVPGGAGSGGEDDSESEIYTYSEFAETLATPRSHKAQQWEDRPIHTDAALAERERQSQRAAEDARRKQERERKYQEELVEFRRAMLQPQPQWP